MSVAARPDLETGLFKRAGDGLLASFGLLATLLALAALGALIWDVAHDGLPRLSWQFLTSYPSRRASDAGILPALAGSLKRKRLGRSLRDVEGAE